MSPRDPDGSFEVGRLSQGWHYLTALVEGGFRSASEPVSVPREAPIDFVVDRAGGRVRGRVVRGG